MIDNAHYADDAERAPVTGSLRRTLIAWFIGLAVVPMAIVSYIGYVQAEKSLSAAAIGKLEDAANSTVGLIQNWFDNRVLDLETLAETKANSALLQQLIAARQRSGLNAAQYVKSFDWALHMDSSEVDIFNLVRRYRHVRDVYLVDNSGDVLVGVSSKSVLGTNLLNDDAASPGLARAIRLSLETGAVGFSDFELLDGSDGVLTAFLVSPLLSDAGDKIGVVVMHLDPTGILQQTAAFNWLDKNRAHYMVGTDGLLRSPLSSDVSGVLLKKIDTEQFRSWKRHIDGVDGPGEFDESVVFGYKGPNGKEVMGLHRNLSLPGTNWALISEINETAAFADADLAGRLSLILAIVAAVVSAGIAWLISRQITRPIELLSAAADSITSGDLSARVTLNESNEIGALADAFNHMVEAREQHVNALEKSKLLAQSAMSDLALQKFAMDQHVLLEITDENGIITFVNDKMIAISGYSRDEMLGQSNRIYNADFADEEFWAALFGTISRGDVWQGEIRNKAKDGSHYWVDTTIVPTQGDSHKSSSFVIIGTDITALKDAEEAAEAGSRAKSDFLANMSHEIRTPMNGVIGMTSLLLDSDLSQEQHRRAVTIQRSAEVLLNIINDILDFSKIEAGKLDLDSIDFDMSTLLEDVASTVSFKAVDKGLKLICPAEPVNNEWYEGDPGRIRQVLTNLIDNAIKFSDSGEVVVRYERVDQNKKRSMLRFSITDSGIGLNTEQRRKLFQKFTQADTSTTRKYGGTGLGLSISKQLVELMGGAIGVSSKLGEGSTFWFTLDLGNAEARPSDRRRENLFGERILVADHDAQNLKWLGDMLDRWQVEHTLVDCGSATLFALRTAASDGKPYNIAIIDAQLTDIEGAQLGRQIRDDPQISSTHCVMLTSKAQRGDADKTHDAGYVAYLSKPANPSEFFNVLMQVAGITGDDGDVPLITRYTANAQPQFEARVLVVEDNLTNQAVAMGMLRKFGVEIELAGNGLEAISLLESSHYDLIFMDCQMPEMDGYDATAHIRDPSSKVLDHAIPIMAMTANAMQGDREKCLQAGMDDYVAKPVHPRDLRKMLERWLPANSRPGPGTGRFRVIDISDPPSVDPAASAGNGKPAPTFDEPVFDDIAMKDRLMGDEALIRTVAETFLEDMAVQIETLKTAAAAGDVEQSSAQAHKIKGAAANVGAMALSARALVMENASAAGEIQNICAGLPELEQSFAQLKTVMKEMLF